MGVVDPRRITNSERMYKNIEIAINYVYTTENSKIFAVYLCVYCALQNSPDDFRSSMREYPRPLETSCQKKNSC